MSEERRLLVSNEGLLIGALIEQDDAWAFQYDEAWRNAQHSFPISPAFPLTKAAYNDGSTRRSVQWFFDNLLPEEAMRDVVSKEQGVRASDSFGLLEALGAESAGSLMLLAADGQEGEKGAQPLPREALSNRIKNLPRASLTAQAPKRMSLAGAQHKMVVLFDAKSGQLSEPLRGSASSHILKPNGQSAEYPHSVINEIFTMRLAGRLGLDVPNVYRLYVPEPVYIVERFDRVWDPIPEVWRRKHVVDACQLLDQPRIFKYSSANMQTLSALIDMCRNRASARASLFRWVLFNTLVGNSDSHLKNISFLIDDDGVRVAPAYDLLSTAVYHTQAFADEEAVWPREPLAIPLVEALVFGEVTRDKLVRSGVALGLTEEVAEREVSSMVSAMPAAADELILSMELEFEAATQGIRQSDEMRGTHGAESRVLRAIRHIIIADMIRLTR